MSIANNHEFKLKSDFAPAGDQPKAINDLIFGADCEKLWNNAIESLGFNYDDLSNNAGSA